MVFKRGVEGRQMSRHNKSCLSIRYFYFLSSRDDLSMIVNLQNRLDNHSPKPLAPSPTPILQEGVP